MDRRSLLGALVSAPVVSACRSEAPPERVDQLGATADHSPIVLATEPLGFQWKVLDPFLFCVHHDDPYPAANASLGPAASLAGRNLGQDFDASNGWRMYHGQTVPGFPSHPHRGFETVTVVRRGLVDHSDSLGAAARYGHGDVQWLTAGKGIVHAEMFPLLDRSGPNPLELFQIWLNLPAVDKFADPHFSMFWKSSIPQRQHRDAQGKLTELTVIAGAYTDAKPSAPPPHSWASRPEAQVAIWTLRLEPGAKFVLPAAPAEVNRKLYFFRGSSLKVNGFELAGRTGAELRANIPATLENGATEGEILMLQGRPIGEPVVQSGPFVMNTRAEIQQAYQDFRSTHFGGWPWQADDPVHGFEPTRFARHADGRTEKAT
ncbi:MAG TPA: pirin family protein [Polyangiaceae bacterium]|nr:pirin family protein [Polyangiaceae bacterium]